MNSEYEMDARCKSSGGWLAYSGRKLWAQAGLWHCRSVSVRSGDLGLYRAHGWSCFPEDCGSAGRPGMILVLGEAAVGAPPA